jgi:hypothetical protein
MPPFTCPLIDHIQAQFADRYVPMPAMAWQGVVLDDLASMLEALRLANAELRIEAERAGDLEAEVVKLHDEIADLHDEIQRLRRSIG